MENFDIEIHVFSQLPHEQLELHHIIPKSEGSGIMQSIVLVKLLWCGEVERDILIVFEDAWEMADMTGILSHICSTGENGKSFWKRGAKNASWLKKLMCGFYFHSLQSKT